MRHRIRAIFRVSCLVLAFGVLFLWVNGDRGHAILIYRGYGVVACRGAFYLAGPDQWAGASLAQVDLCNPFPYVEGVEPSELRRWLPVRRYWGMSGWLIVRGYAVAAWVPMVVLLLPAMFTPGACAGGGYGPASAPTAATTAAPLQSDAPSAARCRRKAMGKAVPKGGEGVRSAGKRRFESDTEAVRIIDAT